MDHSQLINRRVESAEMRYQVKRRKQFNQEKVMDWYRSLLKLPLLKYHIDKFEERYNSHLVGAIETMTEKQLATVLSLLAATYSKGCNDTREYLKSLRIQENAQGGANSKWIAQIQPDCTEANARLIAAAPELLEVLQKIHSIEHRLDMPQSFFDKMHKAINKATGGAK